MFNYHKRLFYPIHVERQDPAFAHVLIDHYTGTDSELFSAIQYLNQRSNISNRHVRELLGIIAAEELGHMELISVAIKKLGGPPLTLDNGQGTPWSINHIDQSLDVINMLQVDIQAETRVGRLYQKHLEMTNDLNMKKMIKFLINRGEVHKRLLKKAQRLIRENGSPEEFNELIYDYKMSLQVLK
ncbi:manganese catalase family protein [Desulfosporosinus youngiae]|uniref:Mn-containing catalase n=1 Tax=Desulfosporosinus youngiae DSM 17734 TaxID=768710 RepID=H5Y1Q8_9FIRM|nr:manganese catalase family protein [Desulfosporosinus youngiae]EHQ87811.1 Mn-containing catalase [Desulfosporosinus youngiae DSM 17734]